MADRLEQAEIIAIRPARNEDGDALGRLIARCWADYPGSYFDRHGEMSGLDRIASDYEAAGGVVWSAVGGDRIVGSVAVAPAGEVGGAWEAAKVYVDPRLRRAGLGRRLMTLAEDHAADHGAQRIVLWTDTRFVTAHRFYERLGYVADGRTRALRDLSNSVEYFYAKPLAGRAGPPAL